MKQLGAGELDIALDATDTLDFDDRMPTKQIAPADSCPRLGSQLVGKRVAIAVGLVIESGLQLGEQPFPAHAPTVRVLWTIG